MSHPLVDRLMDGMAAMRAQRWSDAADALQEVATDPDLAQADDLVDVRARACSLYAQALLEAGRPHEAELPCREAIRLSRQLRDKAGLTEIRSLQDRIVKAIAHDAEQAQRLAEMRRVAATPLPDLLAEADTALARVEALLRKAHAHADTDDAEGGAPVAAQAVQEADVVGEIRQRVMARIAHARCVPADARDTLLQASEIAGDAREFNLVATVARAAEVAGVELPRDSGAHAPRVEEG